MRALSWAVGSSPLARGLPVSVQQTLERAGIIPARAGFTRVIGRFALDDEDHPRSRGVYNPRAIDG